MNHLRYSPKANRYWWAGPFETRDTPRNAGFAWDDRRKVWATPSPYPALALWRYADRGAADALAPYLSNYSSSRSQTDALVLRDTDPRLYPFQRAGVEHIVEQLEGGRRGVLLADEQGLGKTAQALVASRLLGAKRILVVCPASLRHNWASEFRTWRDEDPQLIFKGSDQVDPDRAIVTSYSLAGIARGYRPDLVLIDESHFLKNASSKRTRLVLGALAPKAPTVAMTGTPSPNRPNELWTILHTLGPDVIGGQKYWPFIQRYCSTRETPFGTEITGARNTEELNARLRGSGFMLRRLKEEVLHDLPPKRTKIVAIEPDRRLARVLEREAPFDPAEIYAHGVPVGSALPQIRHEMGLEKVPHVVDYVRTMLDGGVEKVLVFGQHRDVIASLAEGLSEYGAAAITGATSPRARNTLVESFQGSETPRVLIGQIQAAGTGLTLTRACDVVFAEASYVPGENDQCADRVHRIGQTRGVVIHHIVVEGSIDAHILGVAAGKAADSKKVLDRPSVPR